MPPIETMEMNQTAVLWAASGKDKFGKVKVAAPVEIPVRWEWQKAEMTDSSGQKIVTDTVIVVERAIPSGSCLWLGTLAEWTASGLNSQDNGLQQSVFYSEVPDLKGREVRRICRTRRFTDRLPMSA